MRTFIAIDVNEEVKKQASEIIEKLMKRGFGATWVSEENMHLTLFFLGEVDEQKISEIAEHLCRRVRGFPSFSLGTSRGRCLRASFGSEWRTPIA